MRCVYLDVRNMHVGARWKYIVYKIHWAMYLYIIHTLQEAFPKIFQEIVFLHYVKKGLCLSKAEKINFSAEFLRSRSISIVNPQNAMSPPTYLTMDFLFF